MGRRGDLQFAQYKAHPNTEQVFVGTLQFRSSQEGATRLVGGSSLCGASYHDRHNSLPPADIFPAQPSAPYLARRSQTMVLVNGRLCTVQFRKSRKLTPNGREYVRFDTNVRVRKADFALWAMRNGRAIKVYVVPLTHLRKVSSV